MGFRVKKDPKRDPNLDVIFCLLYSSHVWVRSTICALVGSPVTLSRTNLENYPYESPFPRVLRA